MVDGVGDEKVAKEEVSWDIGGTERIAAGVENLRLEGNTIRTGMEETRSVKDPVCSVVNRLAGNGSMARIGDGEPTILRGTIS